MIRRRSAKDISRDELRNEQSEKLLKLVERKQTRHKDVVEAEGAERKPEKVIDLMEVLKASLNARGGKPAEKERKAPKKASASGEAAPSKKASKR